MTRKHKLLGRPGASYIHELTLKHEKYTTFTLLLRICLLMFIP